MKDYSIETILSNKRVFLCCKDKKEALSQKKSITKQLQECGCVINRSSIEEIGWGDDSVNNLSAGSKFALKIDYTTPK